MSSYLIEQHFSYADLFKQNINTARRGSKMYYGRVGYIQSCPIGLKFLHHYLLLKDKAVYVPNLMRVSRSTDLNDFKNRVLPVITRPVTTDERYNLPFYFEKPVIDSFQLKHLCSIKFIEVTGQIQQCFEETIPAWAENSGATEQLGISLALKLTPKHRIRVYTINDHILVFTTKGIADAHENEFLIQRKLFACLPLLRQWTDCDELIELCKAIALDDANAFWTLLEHCCNNDPSIKDLKYASIIDTFNSLSRSRIAHCENQITQCDRNAVNILAQYEQALEQKRTVMRQLLELQTNNVEIDTDTIKMLVDKKICYNLDVSNINSNKISFTCSAPLLNYDKAAAEAIYKRRYGNDDTSDISKLFKLLFIDEKIVLVFDQNIDLNINTGAIQAHSGNTSIYTDLDTSFPNPHHYNHNCWGSYAPVIIKLVQEFKLEEAFYQIKAATGSFNFSDPPVVSGFIRMLNDIVCGDYHPACFLWRDENCTTLHTYEETVQHFAERIDD